MTTSTHEVPMTMSKRAALHLRYDTAEDITLQLLLDTEDLPANARSVIGEIVTQREGEEAEISGVLMARFDRDEPATPTTYRLDTTALTVFAIDQYDQEHDLNAEGEPCNLRGDRSRPGTRRRQPRTAPRRGLDHGNIVENRTQEKSFRRLRSNDSGRRSRLADAGWFRASQGTAIQPTTGLPGCRSPATR